MALAEPQGGGGLLGYLRAARSGAWAVLGSLRLSEEGREGQHGGTQQDGRDGDQDVTGQEVVEAHDPQDPPRRSHTSPLS